MKRCFTATLLVLSLALLVLLAAYMLRTRRVEYNEDLEIDRQSSAKPQVLPVEPEQTANEGETATDSATSESSSTPLQTTEVPDVGARDADEDDGSDLRQKPGQQSDFPALVQRNPAMVAWITIDDTPIDYPVVQAADNETYIEHDVNGKANRNGAIFLDYRNQPDFSGFQSILYGHNMRSGRMFASLNRFEEQAYWDSHRTGTLYTPQGVYALEVFAAARISEYSPLYAYAFVSVNEKQAFLEEIKANASQYRDVGMTQNDRLLLLSTCAKTDLTKRAVVFAKLVPKAD